MDLHDVMRTTASAREFTGEPVTDAEIADLLEVARFAPNGGNRQGWRVILVRDPATRERLAALVEPVARRYAAQVRAGEGPWNTVVPTAVTEAEIAATPVPEWFTRPVFEAAAVLVVCIDLSVVASVDQYLDRVGLVSGASIYPFVWNILLAARNAGLAGTLTTAAIAEEPELQALLGIPPHVAVAAVIPLGHPVKHVTKLTRQPVSTFATLERYDGTPLPDPPTARPGPGPPPARWISYSSPARMPGMHQRLRIRDERPGDAADIAAVTVAAFMDVKVSSHTEQFVVAALRAARALTVSLVAEVDGRIVGHLALSPVTMSDGTPDWYGLGPVSVAPACQRQGIGAALIEEGLSRLRAVGAKGCCLVGHPGYYRRVGFENCTGLAYEDVPQEFFFVLPFEGSLPRGSVAFHEAFSAKV